MSYRYRLLLLLPGIFAIPVGLLLYGWTAQYRVHWIVPIIATSFVGIGTTGSFVSLSHSIPVPFPCLAFLSGAQLILTPIGDNTNISR